MRILHTSDWHVGRTIRGRSRVAEHEAVLDEITKIAVDQRVDLVLVAGDQFDTAAPSAESERVVYRSLLDLAATGAQVVVVAGNHDNPHRLAAVAPLLEPSNVRAGSVLRRPDEGGTIDVTLGSGETARVALLPFLSQRTIVRADDLMELDADQHAGKYAARSAQVIDALCARFQSDTVNLLVGHLMTAGGVLGGGERSAHTIFEYCVPATALPPTAHYVALGHLHRCQEVPAACPAWYSGSPLQLDFGEERDEKAVVLIDAEAGRPATVRKVELQSGRQLRTLKGTLEELEAQTDTTGEDFLRIVVRGQAIAGLAEQVRAWFPEAVDVMIEAPERAPSDEERPQRLGRTPRELFSEYLTEREAMDERVIALFDMLLDEVSTAEAAE